MTPQTQTQPIRGSAQELCLDLVVKSLHTPPAMASCIELVAGRERDTKRLVRFLWRRK